MKTRFILLTACILLMCTITHAQIKIDKSKKPIITAPGNKDAPSGNSKPNETTDKKINNITSKVFADGVGKTKLTKKIPIGNSVIEKVQKFDKDKSTLKTKINLGGGKQIPDALTLRRIIAGTPSKKESKPVPVEGEAGWDCTERKVSVSLTDDSFMNTYNESKSSYIYPGAVYTFDNFYNGSFKEETAKRNPIRIATTATEVNGNIYEIVENPTRFDIMNAKNKIAGRTKLSNTNRGFKAKIYETDNLAETALSIGVGASGYGASFKVDFESNRSTHDRFLLIDVTQEMFSMIAEMPSSGVFVNPADAKKNGLMFLSGITYGFRALVSVKININSSEDLAGFEAKYSGFGFGAEVDIQNLSKSMSKNTEVKMYIVGGENTGFLNVQPNRIMERLDAALVKLNNKTAAPIYFNFVNMNNELVKITSATDEFVDRTCIPKPPQEMRNVYDVKVEFVQMKYTEGDNMDEKIGFDVYGDLLVENKSKGIKRLMCRNKDGVNGCFSVQRAKLKNPVNYKVTENWLLGLSESEMKNASFNFGTSFLGFYEKGIYSDKVSPNYKRQITLKLADALLSKEKSLQPNQMILQADVKSQEVEFYANVYVIAREVPKLQIKVKDKVEMIKK